MKLLVYARLIMHHRSTMLTNDVLIPIQQLIIIIVFSGQSALGAAGLQHLDNVTQGKIKIYSITSGQDVNWLLTGG